MTEEKILEVARRYGVQSRYIDCIAFTEKEIIAFAQSVIEAERERIKQIIHEATDGGWGNYELLVERIENKN